ncbi:Long-chain-fatty-acid--CoA ligase [Pseudovibrio axinellae]|uniref:3-methylmercaptopropionyl-CoA ligase n=1 Tax=Pseudovibrio axinellae TaxID=989403 RepID=A0A166AAQ7_9HYPH|nr:acyl-CoA synthetase [Pseudovibrio axinellae]KZL20799.1 Long-chain-fatty-acid--CoA ligase [Pseudovibrio axinellae]SER22207.1 fatty-acyl-CoA synthase [Pseudovibrio axinellae]
MKNAPSNTSYFECGLPKTDANYTPLSPLSFLERAAKVFPDHTAIIHGNIHRPYKEFYERSIRLASALQQLGIGKNDCVSVMLPNTPPMLEAHYGVPMAGAVLHALNTRLDAAILAFQLDHAESKLVIVDREFSKVMSEALQLATVKPRVVLYDDKEFPQSAPEIGEMEYEELVESGTSDFKWQLPADEWDAISLNYTSGTTGNPKGVVYHHRGAYLLAQANIITAAMGKHPVYLWTLPMFHCNGWCFPWSLSLVAGTHVCLRQVRQAQIWDALADEKVTHLCGAPIVMSTMLNTPQDQKRKLSHQVEFFTAAAPPPEAVLAAMAQEGFSVTHLYGLTEVYGPAVVNEWRSQWSGLPASKQAALKARQGVNYVALQDLAVLDPETMQPVPADGETIGEVMFKGNVVMKGYLKNPSATQEAFAGGWFHSGDLGVQHEDGYVQLKDRSKDIIISGGENISSIEIEEVLYKHPDISAAAVVARPDDKWGETPCAFIELRENSSVTEEAIIQYCKQHMASFKAPRSVVFKDLPKTSTGKIQKFVLREEAKKLA